jgi:hypothetical protein
MLESIYILLAFVIGALVFDCIQLGSIEGLHLSCLKH